MAPLDPPPEGTYATPAIAEAHLQRWAAAHGYATVRKRSKKDKRGQIRKISVICDKGGYSRAQKSLLTDATGKQDSPLKQEDHQASGQESRPRQSSKIGTRKTGCPFLIILKRTLEKQWAVKVVDANHNHEPSLDPSCHPAHRKLTEDEQKIVKSMSAHGSKPLEIFQAMKELNPHSHFTLNDIRHRITRLRRDATAIQASTASIAPHSSSSSLPSLAQMPPLVTLPQQSGQPVASDRSIPQKRSRGRTIGSKNKTAKYPHLPEPPSTQIQKAFPFTDQFNSSPSADEIAPSAFSNSADVLIKLEGDSGSEQ